MESVLQPAATDCCEWSGECTIYCVPVHRWPYLFISLHWLKNYPVRKPHTHIEHNKSMSVQIWQPPFLCQLLATQSAERVWRPLIKPSRSSARLRKITWLSLGCIMISHSLARHRGNSHGISTDCHAWTLHKLVHRRFHAKTGMPDADIKIEIKSCKQTNIVSNVIFSNVLSMTRRRSVTPCCLCFFSFIVSQKLTVSREWNCRWFTIHIKL